MAPRVSIVAVLTCAPAPAWGCLEAIAAQPAEPSFEVMVVAPAAPWLDPVLARLEGDLTIVRADEPWTLAQAFARGRDHATGDTVVLLRDGAVPGPDWLSPLLEALADPAVGTALSLGRSTTAATALGTSCAAWRTADLPAEIPSTTDELLVAQLALDLAQRGLRAEAIADSRVDPSRTGTRPPQLEPRTPPELTIVIPTLDAGSERMRRCLQAIRLCTEVAHQVVIVDNGAPPQGFSDPVNTGIRAAATPYVAVMNDDVEPLPGWFAPLRAALDAGAAVTFPKTVHGQMRTDFAAWCFVMTRATIDRFGYAPGAFFDPSLVVWFQDTDLLVRLRQGLCPPVLVESAQIRHGLSQTLNDPDPVLAAWVRRQVTADQQSFSARWPEVELIPRVAA